MEWSGVEWSGAKWSGVERNGVKWNRAEQRREETDAERVSGVSLCTDACLIYTRCYSDLIKEEDCGCVQMGVCVSLCFYGVGEGH